MTVADELSSKYCNLRGNDFEAFLIDSTLNSLYVGHTGGISKLSTTTWNITLVAGVNSSSADQTELRDATLLRAHFGKFWYYLFSNTWSLKGIFRNYISPVII